MNTLVLKITTLGAYILMLGVNYLAVALPLGGRDTGAISDSYSNLFAPAGYAFSIWGMIYTLLGCYVIYQFSRSRDAVVASVNHIFVVNALLNAGWILVWHYDLIWLSVIIMIGLLITLIKIAEILRGQGESANKSWLMFLPFSVYFGWITVATIANITILLVYLGWDGWGLPESFWTVVVLLIGALLGLWRMLRDRMIPYGLVLIWAYGAILAKHLSVEGFGGEHKSVIGTVAGCLLVLLGVIIYISRHEKEA